jgi:hypothetical protein
MVCGLPYSARVSKKKLRVDGQAVEGYIALRKHEMVIETAPVDYMRVTALHELLHGVVEAQHVGGCVAKGKEERLIDALARGLAMSLAASKWKHKGKRLLPRY